MPVHIAASSYRRLRCMNASRYVCNQADAVPTTAELPAPCMCDRV